MRLPLDPIDCLLALDPTARGIASFFAPGGARSAARSLARGHRIVIATGFVVGAGLPETDGPPGAAVLGRALRVLGRSVIYIADSLTFPLVEAALKGLGEPVDVVVFPEGEPAEEWARGFLREIGPSHLVAVERPGRARDGDYRNARGESIAAWNRPVDSLFLLRRRGLTTIGIGDGGNEIGMGNVRARLLRQGTLARRVASVVKVDHLVVAGISNWGAYGVTAHLSFLAGRCLLHTADEDRGLVAACVEAGGVDGLTWRREATVDGVSAEAHAAMVELFRVVTRRTGGGRRS
ncbi:MAG: DUF4392 domain-containing protein [Candidatus Methylomirabilia bacterium]